jgi:hypothetical protein
MDVTRLEDTLVTALAARPTTRNLRNILVDYYTLAARPHIERGLRHTAPGFADDTVRRILLLRIGTLWHDLASTWDEPSLEDLRTFRRRIEDYACVRHDPQFSRTQRLLDELMLAAAVSRRVDAARARQRPRKFLVIEGGGRRSAPCGRLRLVGAEPKVPQLGAPPVNA